MRWLPTSVVLCLAATLLASPPAGAQLADAQRVRTVHRAYGDGPVRIGRADVLRIRFEGRRGDRVRLGGTYHCAVSLRGPGGAKVPSLPSGFWRLASRGRQTFRLTRCPALDGSDTVQLEKLRVSRPVINGAGRRLGGARGFVDAVGVKVPESGELKVFGTDLSPSYAQAFEGLILPDGSLHPPWYLNTYYFEAGRKISTPSGQLRGSTGSLVTAAGDKVLLLVERPVTVWESTAIPVATTVDGPALNLPAGEVPYREYQVEFDAVEGSWLHSDVTWPDGGRLQTRLVRAGGRHVRSLQIPATERYRLMVPTWEATGTLQVQIRTITQVASPMPVDGTHLTLTADEPGEWVLAWMTLSESNAFYRMQAHSFTATGSWDVLATSTTPLRCGRHSGNGCGDWSQGLVAPEFPTSTSFGLTSGLPNPWLVLLRPAPGVTASVELSVSPSTMSRISRPALRSAG